MCFLWLALYLNVYVLYSPGGVIGVIDLLAASIGK